MKNIALDELINIFEENDIITKRTQMPIITYELNNKNYRYYPDIWIKSLNKIIEVKSSWTYQRDLIKNVKKALATRRLNYDFEFWIYSHKPFNKVII